MIAAKELRELLATIPDDTPIVLQRDDEGNGYRYMHGLDFEPSGDEANYFNGSFRDGDCVKGKDFGEWAEPTDYPQLVAVAF